MAETLEQFLARTTGPCRALPAVCQACGGEVVYEAHYGGWSHKNLTSCERSNEVYSFYVPKRMA